MSAASEARVPTASGSRYLQQLCKHWSHNLEVSFDKHKGTVNFPAQGRSGNWQGPGVVTMTAGEDHLLCRIDGSEEAQVDALKGVLARHLDRFAFREAPLSFEWEAVEPA